MQNSTLLMRHFKERLFLANQSTILERSFKKASVNAFYMTVLFHPGIFIINLQFNLQFEKEFYN